MLYQLLSNPVVFYGSAFVVATFVFFGPARWIARKLGRPWYTKDIF